MARKFLTSLDLAKNELLNARIQNLSAAPSSPVAGQIYFSTVDNSLYVYTGTTWASVATGDAFGDGSVTTTKLADGAVTTIKLADGTVTTVKIANGSVTTAKLDDGAVTAAKLASNAVTNDKIADAAVNTAQLADGAVTTGKIADGTITNADVSASAAIAYSKLNLSGSVTNSDISASAAISLSKLATDPLARANHTGTQTASTISDFDTQVRSSRLDQMAAPTSSVSLNAQRLTNVADPTNAQDAATKAYVDATKQGLDVKDSVKVATTGNYNLTGEEVIDGVQTYAGDRVLVKSQTNPAENGIYVISVNSWTRASDANSNAKVTPGMFVFVEEGTTNADSGWVLTTDGAITLGTTALTFTQFSSAGQITAGAGLTKSGNTLSVGAGAGITVNADDVAIDTTVVARKYTTTVGNGVDLNYTITHNLGTRAVVVSVYESASPYAEVMVDVEKTSTNTVTLRFATAPTSGEYTIAIVG